MASMARESWTDQRLDDLKGSTDAGFQEMHEEFRAVRDEMSSEFRAVRAEMREEFRAIRGELGEMRGEIAALGRSFQQLTWGLIGTMLVGFLSTTAAILTRL
jgi:predicted phage gp36 major capsid-like protein